MEGGDIFLNITTSKQYISLNSTVRNYKQKIYVCLLKYNIVHFEAYVVDVNTFHFKSNPRIRMN